jgi:tryptophan synthase beta subunit
MREAKTRKPGEIILVNLSGRGDKDLGIVTEYYKEHQS